MKLEIWFAGEVSFYTISQLPNTIHYTVVGIANEYVT